MAHQISSIRSVSSGRCSVRIPTNASATTGRLERTMLATPSRPATPCGLLPRLMLFKSTARGNVADTAAAIGATSRQIAATPAGTLIQSARGPRGNRSKGDDEARECGCRCHRADGHGLSVEELFVRERRQQLQGESRAVESELVHRERQRSHHAEESGKGGEADAALRHDAEQRVAGANGQYREHEKDQERRKKSGSAARRPQSEPDLGHGDRAGASRQSGNPPDRLRALAGRATTRDGARKREEPLERRDRPSRARAPRWLREAAALRRSTGGHPESRSSSRSRTARRASCRRRPGRFARHALGAWLVLSEASHDGRAARRSSARRSSDANQRDEKNEGKRCELASSPVAHDELDNAAGQR